MNKLLKVLVLTLAISFTPVTNNVELCAASTVKVAKQSNGKVDSKTFYTNGKRTKYEDWNNGKKVSTITYKSGKVDAKYFYTNGKKTRYEDWNNGKKVLVVKYSNGKVDRKYFYTNGKKTRYEDWNNGKKVRTIKYKNGKVVSDTKSKSSSSSNSSYKTYKVGACNLSGSRHKNAKVDIGYGSRKYYAYTNKYGQLTKVTAKNIVLQKKSEENSNGRYCRDEAKVPGTEKSNLDEGHVIADSLGGVSNAYNITPQASNVNRSGGVQYKFEQEILKAEQNGKQVTDFKMIIKYANKSTQTPSSYKVTYKIAGRNKSYTFNNKTKKSSSTSSSSNSTSSSSSNGAWSSNGKDYGTCAAAKSHYGSSWPGYRKGYNKEYSYHRDSNNNGWVCGTKG